MIRLQLPIDENIKLLLSTIGYACRTSLTMELGAFLSDREAGYFSKNEYRLTAIQDLQSHIEISENGENMVLVLHPRTIETDKVLQKIIEQWQNNMA